MSQTAPSTAIGLLFCDSHLNVFAADGMFLQLFGVAREAVVGSQACDVLQHPELRDEFLESLLFDEYIHDELVQANFPTGGRRTLSLSISPIHLENLAENDGLVISVEDVTC